MAAPRYCLSLLLLSCCVALLSAQRAPQEPVYPGDDATPEQMAKYAAEMRRYIDRLTRPRSKGAVEGTEFAIWLLHTESCGIEDRTLPGFPGDNASKKQLAQFYYRLYRRMMKKR
ncbi:pancreatic polypeptide prohormone [Sminthopsis crassicaudata]|uniref:pancreatic polypeptide prohormone n=1 Tax=Sminthopsis crassicaudata TaxID=9301 RepID=UPI003D6817D8